MKIGLLTLCLICCSPILHAQNLSISEVIAMRKSTGVQIDSIMKGKGFVKKVVQQNSDYSIITYTYTGVVNGSSVQRSLHIGRRPKIHNIELQYGVWQKQEAADIIDQLTGTGFKKVSMQIPDMDGKSSATVSYRKGGNSLSYAEQNQGANHTLYIFSVNNADFK